jgi:hypothetical protein
MTEQIIRPFQYYKNYCTEIKKNPHPQFRFLISYFNYLFSKSRTDEIIFPPNFISSLLHELINIFPQLYENNEFNKKYDLYQTIDSITEFICVYSDGSDGKRKPSTFSLISQSSMNIWLYFFDIFFQYIDRAVNENNSISIHNDLFFSIIEGICIEIERNMISNEKRTLLLRILEYLFFDSNIYYADVGNPHIFNVDNLPYELYISIIQVLFYTNQRLRNRFLIQYYNYYRSFGKTKFDVLVELSRNFSIDIIVNDFQNIIQLETFCTKMKKSYDFRKRVKYISSKKKIINEINALPKYYIHPNFPGGEEYRLRMKKWKKQFA